MVKKGSKSKGRGRPPKVVEKPKRKFRWRPGTVTLRRIKKY